LPDTATFNEAVKHGTSSVAMSPPVAVMNRSAQAKKTLELLFDLWLIGNVAKDDAVVKQVADVLLRAYATKLEGQVICNNKFKGLSRTTNFKRYKSDFIEMTKYCKDLGIQSPEKAVHPSIWSECGPTASKQ